MGQEQSTLQDNENNDNKLVNNSEEKNEVNNNEINNENKTEENIKDNTSSNNNSQKPKALKIDTNFENGQSITSPLNDYKSPVLSVKSIRKSYKSKDFLSANIIDCLADLSSTTSYPLDHEIWKNLLKKEKIPLVNSRQCAFDMNIAVNIVGTEIRKNNHLTKNFTKLILNLLSELSTSRGYKNDINMETRNSLYITRLLSKYFIENLSNKEIIELFDSDIEPNESKKDTPSETTDNNDNNNTNMDDTSKQSLPISEVTIKKKTKLEFLIEELFNVLIYLPLTSDNNLEFYDEVLNTFITFTASRYQNDIKNTDNYILTTILKILNEQENENLAGKVITKLLLNVIYSNDQKEGLLSKVLRKNSINLNLIARKSLYLFLVLTNQPNQIAKNELSNLVNEISNIQESGDIEIRSEIPSLNISFQSLYKLICEKINENEEISLLLYQLISQNTSFRSFILSKIDPDLLLLPLLQTLYCSFKEKTDFNKIYTLLITLLIMSQDEIYTETLQRIEITNPSWFIDNNLKIISLSNFTLLILFKIIQINLAKYKDIYLHSNCLAILTNLAIKMDNIHYYSAQKLIGLLGLVQKKYFKMRKIDSDNITDEEDQEEKNMENKINEDLIMLLLEIINSCLINSLKTNLQLVYSVMRGKEIINKLKDIDRFKEPIENISYTIEFFESKIVFEEDLPSSEEIMNQIVQISKSWDPSKLKKTETIKFKFEEEKDYSLFFLPYIYNIIYSNTLMFVH